MSVRLQISVSDSLAADIDKYAEKVGVSRNALCAMLLHNSILDYNYKIQQIDESAKEELYNMQKNRTKEGI